MPVSHFTPKVKDPHPFRYFSEPGPVRYWRQLTVNTPMGDINLSSPLTLAGIAAVAWFLFLRKKK